MESAANAFNDILRSQGKDPKNMRKEDHSAWSWFHAGWCRSRRAIEEAESESKESLTDSLLGAWIRVAPRLHKKYCGAYNLNQ